LYSSPSIKDKKRPAEKGNDKKEGKAAGGEGRSLGKGKGGVSYQRFDTKTLGGAGGLSTSQKCENKEIRQKGGRGRKGNHVNQRKKRIPLKGKRIIY